ncbi:MAG TPA: hypothetical protein PK562_05635 [Candidatus Omnitrophota bacterium]|nr:hypothetical protein [Candidatus Omnitrophota bacterium]
MKRYIVITGAIGAWVIAAQICLAGESIMTSGNDKSKYIGYGAVSFRSINSAASEYPVRFKGSGKGGPVQFIGPAGAGTTTILTDRNIVNPDDV